MGTGFRWVWVWVKLHTHGQTWPLGRAAGGPARGTPFWPGPGPARPVACRARAGPFSAGAMPGPQSEARVPARHGPFSILLLLLLFLQIFSFFPAFLFLF